MHPPSSGWHLFSVTSICTHVKKYLDTCQKVFAPTSRQHFSGDYNSWPLSKHAHEPVQAGLPSTLIIKISSKVQSQNIFLLRLRRGFSDPSSSRWSSLATRRVTWRWWRTRWTILKKIDFTLNHIDLHKKKINYILLMSWQVSNQCMALVNDKIIVPTKVGALMTEQ